MSSGSAPDLPSSQQGSEAPSAATALAAAGLGGTLLALLAARSFLRKAPAAVPASFSASELEGKAPSKKKATAPKKSSSSSRASGKQAPSSSSAKPSLPAKAPAAIGAAAKAEEEKPAPKEVEVEVPAAEEVEEAAKPKKKKKKKPKGGDEEGEEEPTGEESATLATLLVAPTVEDVEVDGWTEVPKRRGLEANDDEAANDERTAARTQKVSDLRRRKATIAQQLQRLEEGLAGGGSAGGRKEDEQCKLLEARAKLQEDLSRVKMSIQRLSSSGPPAAPADGPAEDDAGDWGEEVWNEAWSWEEGWGPEAWEPSWEEAWSQTPSRWHAVASHVDSSWRPRETWEEEDSWWSHASGSNGHASGKGGWGGKGGKVSWENEWTGEGRKGRSDKDAWSGEGGKGKSGKGSKKGVYRQVVWKDLADEGHEGRGDEAQAPEAPSRQEASAEKRRGRGGKGLWSGSRAGEFEFPEACAGADAQVPEQPASDGADGVEKPWPDKKDGCDTLLSILKSSEGRRKGEKGETGEKGERGERGKGAGKGKDKGKGKEGKDRRRDDDDRGRRGGGGDSAGGGKGRRSERERDAGARETGSVEEWLRRRKGPGDEVEPPVNDESAEVPAPRKRREAKPRTDSADAAEVSELMNNIKQVSLERSKSGDRPNWGDAESSDEDSPVQKAQRVLKGGVSAGAAKAGLTRGPKPKAQKGWDEAYDN